MIGIGGGKRLQECLALRLVFSISEGNGVQRCAARLTEVQYVDSKNSKSFVRGGMFIEDDDDV